MARTLAEEILFAKIEPHVTALRDEVIKKIVEAVYYPENEDRFTDALKAVDVYVQGVIQVIYHQAVKFTLPVEKVEKESE